ncbi:MAG: class I SAM-dependent methyltransferase [Mariniphaga sp.]
MQTVLHAQIYQMEPLVNYFKDIEVRHILDVGTGTGGFIPVLRKAFPEAQITGVDPNPTSIVTARQNYADLTFLVNEAEHLDFVSDTFDVASLSMVLHHLPKIKMGLKEIGRVVKPEGYIIINEPISDGLNAAQEVHKLYHHFRSRIDRLLGNFHRKTFSKEAVLQMLKEAELPVQFIFEQRKNINLVENANDIEIRSEKMKQMLEKIKDKPEYEVLKPQIEDFRGKALKYGFQPATTLVIVIRNIKQEK